MADFDAWRTVVPPATTVPTQAAEWRGALVLVESGEIEVIGQRGVCCSFGAGQLIALAALGPAALRNAGTRAASLLAVRVRSAR